MQTAAPYRDASVPIDQRIEDLLGRMTLEEKAGLMFHPPAFIEADGSTVSGTEESIVEQHLNHFNIYAAPPPRQHAEWHNRLQEIAASTRLGIPVTISSDPRHMVGESSGASGSSAGLSQWPEPIGFAAVGDAAAVEEFGDIARREYRAVGIHVALHPTADLATEPRWARIVHTFGEDAALAARLVAAYVRGFQGDSLGPQSVACMTKHFPGGGPQRDGEDPHFPYGKDQIYPGGMFEHHVRVFEAAFAAGSAQIMPYYGRPVGTPFEAVGFGYNRRRHHRAVARALRLRRRRLHRLGARHRHDAARRLGLGGQSVGCGGALATRSALRRSSTRVATSSAVSEFQRLSSHWSRTDA